MLASRKGARWPLVFVLAFLALAATCPITVRFTTPSPAEEDPGLALTMTALVLMQTQIALEQTLQVPTPTGHAPANRACRHGDGEPVLPHRSRALLPQNRDLEQGNAGDRAGPRVGPGGRLLVGTDAFRGCVLGMGPLAAHPG